MHISVDERPTTVTFAPDRRLGWLAVALAAVFAAAGAVSDAPGRLLCTLAVLVLAVHAVNGLLNVPRLTAGPDGLEIRSLGRRERIGWHEVERLAVDERDRLGRRTRMLEIDCGQRLVVLSGYALGSDPRDVLRALESARSPGQR